MKKSTMKKTKKEEAKAVVVQPVHLPVVTEVVKPQKRGRKFFWITFLIILNLVVWYYASFKCFEIYNFTSANNRPARLKVFKPKHKKNVVAVIGKEEISLDEVKAFVKEIPQLEEIPFEQVYPNILEMMINDKVIANGAVRYGIPKDPQIKQMIKMAKNQIIAQAYLTKEIERVLTDKDIRETYDEEVKNFKPQEEIHARHILVLTEKQAQDILIQLKAGADFGLLADQKSIDKNAPQGDLGYFTKEMMIPEFAEAVFSMKKGQLSGPVHTAYGWHIIQVEDRRPTQPPEFKQVKEQMRQMAVEKKIPEIIAAERARQNVRVVRPSLTESTPPAKTEETKKTSK